MKIEIEVKLQPVNAQQAGDERNSISFSKNITFPLSTVILLNRRQGRHPTERFLTAHASARRVNIEKQIAEMKKNQPDKPSLNTLLLGT